MRSAHVGKYAEDDSDFKRRGRAVRYRLKSNRTLGSSITFAKVAIQSNTASFDRLTERTDGVQTERIWSNETHRVETCSQRKNG